MKHSYEAAVKLGFNGTWDVPLFILSQDGMMTSLSSFTKTWFC